CWNCSCISNTINLWQRRKPLHLLPILIMNPKAKKETVGHRLIVNYRGASRNAASVILTVWLVGIASWFVSANSVYTSSLAIEPGISREVSISVSKFVKDFSESVGVGSVENVIDRIRNRNRDGISLVEQTIAAEQQVNETIVPEIPEPIAEISRPGDGLILNSIPVLDQNELSRENVGRTVRVLVTGDSLSTYPGQELVKLMAGNENFVIRMEWANGSGLTKPNVLDWAQYARDLTAKYQPDLVIIILGGSDTVNMVTNGELIERTSDAWIDEYSRRIQLVTAEFQANKVTNVIWAGPPPARDKNRNLSYTKINSSLTATAAAIPGLKHLDTFTQIQPKLSATVDGKSVLLRQADGVHWTREASRLIAIELNEMLTVLRP
ncbi:MAG: hypothetical protein ACO3DX_02100, partial [Candidatus Nanopelagicales bacterium]